MVAGVEEISSTIKDSKILKRKIFTSLRYISFLPTKYLPRYLHMSVSLCPRIQNLCPDSDSQFHSPAFFLCDTKLIKSNIFAVRGKDYCLNHI